MSDKASHERRARNILVRHRNEIVQEHEEPVGFSVFRAVLGNGGEYRLRVAPEHGELHEIGRVEQHVGVFLVGIYPLHLGAPDVGPVGYRLPGAVRPQVVIPDYAAQEPVVARRDAVVVIQRYAGYRIDEYPEFPRVGNPVEQGGVQRMYALYQEHVSGARSLPTA